jgi:hypothetical protein
MCTTAKEMLEAWRPFIPARIPSAYPARDRMLRMQHDDRIQAEASLANQIQAQVPVCARSEALRVACRILDRG